MPLQQPAVTARADPSFITLAEAEPHIRSSACTRPCRCRDDYQTWMRTECRTLREADCRQGSRPSTCDDPAHAMLTLDDRRAPRRPQGLSDVTTFSLENVRLQHRASSASPNGRGGNYHALRVILPDRAGRAGGCLVATVETLHRKTRHNKKRPPSPLRDRRHLRHRPGPMPLAPTASVFLLAP